MTLSPAEPTPPPVPPLLPDVVPQPEPAPSPRTQFIARHESHNLLVLAAYHVMLRVAWIFKTESVIVPAFLDAIAGAGWLRGCLPVLNRLGQSVPPLLSAETLQQTRRKKWPLILTALCMALPFLILSALWLGLGRWSVDRTALPWLPWTFLALYFVFFSMTGLNQLAFSTLQGKLIRADRRGRLMTLSGFFGSLCSIAGAWFFLRNWLTYEGGGFEWIFGITGAGFVLAGLVCLGVKEPLDPPITRRAIPLSEHFRRAWRTFRDDREFRQLAWTGTLFITGMMLFPHYQALGRERLGTQPADLLPWVIAQNAGMGIFSTLAGGMADRFGNRLSLRLCIFAAATAPVMALALANGWLPGGRDWYWVTFFLLGLTPMTMRCLINYVLELSEESGHALHVSTLTLTMAVPFLISPLLGALVDLWGFDSVFWGVAGLMACGGLMTFRLIEPRHESSGQRAR